MRTICVISMLIAMLAGACASTAIRYEPSGVSAACAKTLHEQSDAWNRGDLEGFLWDFFTSVAS